MIENKRIKNWGFLISLFILFLVSPLKVHAADSLSLVGDSAISLGSTIKYDIVLNLDNATTLVTGFSTDVNYDSTVLTLSKIELGTDWNGSTTPVASGKTITFDSDSGVTGKTKVATLVFKVNSSATSNSAYITLKAPSYSYKNVTDGSDTMKNLNEISKTLAVKSSDNTLKALKVNGVLVEGFSSDIYEYEVSVESKVETAKILATTNSTKATLKAGSGNRTVTLNYGSNVVNVIVVSESGLEQTYTINITREDTRSTDTTLSSITVDGVSIPNFKSSTYKYTVKKYKTEGVSIVGITNDPKATVVVTQPPKVIIGENTYVLTVTSENGDSAVYTVIINNIDTNISKKLKTLSIHGYSIDFDKNNNRYEIRYNKKKFKELHVYFSTVASSDEVTATLSPDINNDAEALSKLRAGDEITVTITGIDGESVEYTIVIVNDNRISFFLILELFIMAVVVVVIIIIYRKRKKEKTKPRKSVKKDSTSKPKEKVTEKSEKKKKRFSIYEDEYEEVEVEVDDADDYSATKELTDEELNLK